MKPKLPNFGRFLLTITGLHAVFGTGGAQIRNRSPLPFARPRPTLCGFATCCVLPRPAQPIGPLDVQSSTRSFVARTLMWAVLTGAASALAAPQAGAEAMLVIEAESGKVLFAENATYPWYPASITKLMTAYVTLREVKEEIGRASCRER